jgi:hypothetical protein
MTDLEKLDVGTVTQLTHSSGEDFKEMVEDKKLTIKDLKALKEAESSGKNRESILNFLDKQITSENVENYLSIADKDANEIEHIIEKIEKLEDLDHLDEDKIEVDQDKLIDLLGGNVEEMKEFIEENPLTLPQLEDILDAEERIKNRKTAKSFLEKKMKEREASESLENAAEDIESLEKNLKEIEGLEDDITDENNKNSSIDELASALENENEEAEVEDDGDSSEESEKKGDDEKEEDEEPEESEGEGEEKKEETDLEKKKKIAEELELEMSERELDEIPLEEIEKMRDEKRHREDLIETLKHEGMSEEDLRNSSTSDLEKIADNMDNEEESQEEHEEMREEAEEDLEMLMGAVRGGDDDEDENSKDAREKLGDLKKRIEEKLNRSSSGEEESTQRINEENVQEVLDEYKELDDEEAAVKTAHIMKGFLEQKLGIGREMTYKELAEKMPEDQDESIEELAEFFVKMNKEQYTGRIDVEDSEAVIDICQEVINKLG